MQDKAVGLSSHAYIEGALYRLHHMVSKPSSILVDSSYFDMFHRHQNPIISFK